MLTKGGKEMMMRMAVGWYEKGQIEQIVGQNLKRCVAYNEPRHGQGGDLPLMRLEG